MNRYEVRTAKSEVTYWKCRTLEDARAVLAEHGHRGDFIFYRGKVLEVKDDGEQTR